MKGDMVLEVDAAEGYVVTELIESGARISVFCSIDSQSISTSLRDLVVD